MVITGARYEVVLKWQGCTEFVLCATYCGWVGNIAVLRILVNQSDF